MTVTKTGEFVSLDQKSYLEKILLQFEIGIYKPAFLPKDSNVPKFILFVPENQQSDKDNIF